MYRFVYYLPLMFLNYLLCFFISAETTRTKIRNDGCQLQNYNFKLCLCLNCYYGNLQVLLSLDFSP